MVAYVAVLVNKYYSYSSFRAEQCSAKCSAKCGAKVSVGENK